MRVYVVQDAAFLLIERLVQRSKQSRSKVPEPDLNLSNIRRRGVCLLSVLLCAVTWTLARAPGWF